MSLIHVQHIESHLIKEYDGKIALNDQRTDSDNYHDMFLPRALAAYAIRMRQTFWFKLHHIIDFPLRLL